MKTAVVWDTPEEQVQPPEGFESLVRQEQDRLLRLAWRFTRDAEEARDLVQAALADAFEQRGQLRDAAAGPAWLRRVLVHRAVSWHRRQKLRRTLVPWLHTPEAESFAPNTDAELDRARRMAQVHSAVRELPTRQAAAFTLRYLEGLSLDETAQALGIDRGTVRIHLYRALKKLKALRALEEGAPDDV